MSNDPPPPTDVERAEILAVLQRVTPSWPATFDADSAPFGYDQAFGNVDFVLPNGWRVTVFKDGFGFDAWDYIERIETNDGRAWEFPFEPYPVDSDEDYPPMPLNNYEPAKGAWKPHRGGRG